MESDFCEAKYLTALEGRESTMNSYSVDSCAIAESVPLFLSEVVDAQSLN